ncbi:MAG: MFS transporter, partial [Burkholderiales bacterium]|nr:MFS transporter [Burkholderiales bacterium]
PFLYPFAGDAWQLLGLRFLHGFATAIFSPVASAYVAAIAQERRGARLGWFSSANDLGATAGPLLGGLVLFATGEFVTPYLVVGALGIAALAMVLLVPEPSSPAARAGAPPGGRAAEFHRGLREVLGTRPILVASSVEAVMYLGFGAFLGFLPLFAKTQGLNDAEIALVLALQLATALLAKPFTGRASDRLGRVPVIVAGLVLCALALPLIFRAQDLAELLLAAPLLGLGVAAVTPVASALIADLAHSRHLGAAMGVFGTIWDVGEALGPILAGVLIARLGYAFTFDILAALTILAAIGFVLAIRDPGPPDAIRG